MEKHEVSMELDKLSVENKGLKLRQHGELVARRKAKGLRDN